MSRRTNALGAAAAAVLMGGFAVVGIATAAADPSTGNSADINTLAAIGVEGLRPQQLPAAHN